MNKKSEAASEGFLNSELKAIKERFGQLAILRLPFYLLTALLTTPVRLIQTLWSCRVLLEGRWGDYPHFAPHLGIMSLFYWIRAFNIFQHGRTGHAPNLGLGNYDLSRCFNYSLPSLYAYWGAGAVSILFGMFSWWLAHLLWWESIAPGWLCLIMGLSLISTFFYGNTFGMQNYNALGWCFFPVWLFSVMHGNWLLAAIAMLLISFGSFTCVVMAGMLSFVIAATTFSWMPVIACLPVGFKLLTHLRSRAGWKEYLVILRKVAAAIGLTHVNVKYRRKRELIRMVHNFYYIALFIPMVAAYWWTGSPHAYLLFGGLGIMIINAYIARFSDYQSIYMLMFSLSTAAVIEAQNPWLLIPYLFAVNPLPYMIGIQPNRLCLDVVPKMEPFSIRQLRQDMESFLQPVCEGQRVLMAFENPNGNYRKVFDGYRAILELPLYIAAEKNFHLMPDWWAVFEVNYEGAPEFWGRDVESVKANLEQWKADYALVYQEDNPELAPQWQKAGFEVLGRFSWKDCNFRSTPLSSMELELPIWWLLKPGETQ
jgi:hypothetical protein